MDAYVHLVPWIIALPLVGFLLNGLFGLAFESYRDRKNLIGAIATSAVFFPFLIALYLFFAMSGDSEAASVSLFTWMQAGDFSVDIAYRLDQLSILMTLVVTGVGALIHLYSVGYMADDEGFWKFFAFMNLFIFAMLNLVLADNMLLLFLGWEGVGLCSYLLIGFWYTDMAKSDAAKKAFLYNRVGDFAFLIAMFLVFQITGSLRFQDILDSAYLFSTDQAFLVGALIFIGATGKSAQIPLFVWLPDAMAGPTSVSALIHAATMVTSGIYVISRLSPLYMMSPELMLIVAVIGALTALVAATIALTRYDIKAVLAYSTVSQLGFMFLALGSGAFVAAMFHVVTHAFFKACLFLGSGSVIHAMHHVEHKLHKTNPDVHFDPQDMRFMGGLRAYLPSTYKTFLIATIAIAGIPPLAGFFSKDEILVMTFNAGAGVYGSIYYVLWAMAMLTAFMTAFYMFRLTFGIFHGSFRLPKLIEGAKDSAKLLHESPWTMTSVLWGLAVLSVIGGFIGIPNFVVATFTGTADVNLLSNWLDKVTLDADLILSKQVEWMLLSGSVLVASLGIFVAYKKYGNQEPVAEDEAVAARFGPLYSLWNKKYLFDEMYEGGIVRPVVRFSDRVLAVFDIRAIDGFVNFIASFVRFFGHLARYLQTGMIQTYAYGMVIGVVLILYLLIIR
ncbi:NADH-quinone oxidoreductase subunit L [Balneolaceae bacterium ANBcel3]|nr:NADH-quinone oxidoreductase subunit L [Balneolaceae bacterium ANBcel3]